MSIIILLTMALKVTTKTSTYNDNMAAVKTNSFRLITTQDMMDPDQLQDNLDGIIPVLYEISQFNMVNYTNLNDHWKLNTMEPLVRHLTNDLIISIRQIKQLLSPIKHRQARNVIGDVIASLTGLATQKQLEEVANNNEGEIDQNLLHIADLTRNQDSIHQKIKQLTIELTAINEVSVNNSMGFIYITRIQQLTTYTLQLILLTTEYKREWTDIMSSISNRNTNHHTIPLEAMMAARKRFHMYYGSKNAVSYTHLTLPTICSV